MKKSRRMRKTPKRRVKKSVRMRTIQSMQPMQSKPAEQIEYKNKTDFGQHLKMGLGLGAGLQLAEFAADGVKGLFE